MTVVRKDYKSLTDIKVLDETLGLVEADVNTMGLIDADNDVIRPTAFNKSILNNLPIPVLIQHDQSAVVGKVVSASVVAVDDKEHRLRALMQMNLQTEGGRDAFSNIKGQYYGQYSVGFNMPNDGASVERDESGKNVRMINNLDWVETSLVVRGASPNTQTISAKSEEIVSNNESEEIALPDADVETDNPTSTEGNTVDEHTDKVQQEIVDAKSRLLLRVIEQIKSELGD
tara:strand:- start:485 stop:1174 length:690 start_codon:yes stop_codon:yes gene_type:complete